MLDQLNGNYILNLFNEYEEHHSNEAKFVKSLDLFDMYLQAYEYESLNENKIDLSEFFSKIPSYLLEDSNEEKDEDNLIKKCLKELLEVRNKKLNYLPPDSNINTVLKFRINKTE
jgi:5'-deoxynucleotidase YfbR-like HD superfamily hydrolase